MMRTIGIPLLILMVLIVFVWGGLKIRPKAFALPLAAGASTATIPIPQGLPEPVDRFYRTLYGDRVPRIETAVFTGRGRIRPFGLWMPVRFVFTHRAGKDYRHYFEATFYGLPFMKVDEGYLDGVSFMDGPMGHLLDEPNTNQGANLALWAEAGWFPSVWLTDPRVRWEAVDPVTALLYVPFGEASESFVVRFDPATGLMDSMEAMRYREPGAGKAKILWIARMDKTPEAQRGRVISTASAIWLDQGKPWANFQLEAAALNGEVEAYLRGRGY